MDAHAENTKRIAKNTLMLYVRMLFGMLVSLYTSRVVLQALGVEDYGIYNVVGGFVAMFSMISASLSSSVGRFLTFELGKGDVDALKWVFSTSLSIHVVLSVIIVLLAETVGVWFLNTNMIIPETRLYAANWVFHASIFAFVINLWSVPFSASIVAHERMSAFAYIGILDIVLRLLIVLFIAYSGLGFDRLIVYALLLVCVGCIMQAIYWNYCTRHFEECKFRLSFDAGYWKAMSSFAGWNFIGCTAGLLKEQGVNVLLNLFMGPVINAARGIAGTVNNVLASFSNNFMTALNPQITKSYAAGDYEYMFSLVERGSRFSYYILLIFALPVLFETEFILTLWLKSYPEHTVNFVRLILIVTLCDLLSNTLINLQSATGRIRNYQLVVGGMLLMNFPLSYLCLKFGYPPESTLIVTFVVSVCCLLLRLIFLRTMVGLSVKKFLRKVCMNVLLVTFVAAIIPFLIYIQMNDSIIRFFLICIVTVFCSSLTIYFVGCSANERNFIKGKILSIYQKKFQCCGCTACVSACPKKCISTSADKEGFLYPVVDSVKCIGCGLCEKVCPVLHPVNNKVEPLVYAAINNDETVRMQSSSGGIFTLLADSVLDRGGVVFGACFDSDWNVVHDYTETKDGLARFRGSKYVQSNIGNSFTLVKAFLDSGREVLFSGTPCQVAGLKSYLRKSYSNLLTVDLVCHGVPSPEVWRKYLQETISKAYGIKNNKAAVNPGDYISDISFRAKDKGWKKYNVKIIFRDGKMEMTPFFENPYMNVFLSDLSLRPSCYACPAKLHNVQSDITLADFWGVNKINPDIDDNKGCGIVLIHRMEKLAFLCDADCQLLQQQFSIVIKYNPCVLHSVKKPVSRFVYFNFLQIFGFYKTFILEKNILCQALGKVIEKVLCRYGK